MNTGKLLRDVRNFCGRTQFEVAEGLGISWRTYQRYESGETKVNLPFLVDFFKFLNIETFSVLLYLFKHNMINLPFVENFKLNDPNHSIKRSSIPLFPIGNFNKVEEEIRLFGVWQWDYKNNIYYWSDDMFEILELDKDGAISFIQVLAKISSEDHFLIYLSLERIFKSRTAFSIMLKRKHSKLGEIEIIWSAESSLSDNSMIGGEAIVYKTQTA